MMFCKRFITWVSVLVLVTSAKGVTGQEGKMPASPDARQSGDSWTSVVTLPSVDTRTSMDILPSVDTRSEWRGAEGDYLYRIALVQAAPGRFNDFMDMMRRQFEAIVNQGDSRPFWIRHTQGDRWDFMIVYPMEEYDSFYSSERLSRIAFNDATWASFEKEEDSLIALREDLFVRGTPWNELEEVLSSNSYYHVEMFTALSGRREELLAQRRMENDYLSRLGRPQNFIFRRVAGSSVDSFTLGCYRDIKHYVESADIPADVEEKAAVEAGFDGVSAISPYLRSLISGHHDTLAVAIDQP